MRIVNVGILAHVDAGKTTLSDQLLFRAGVIAAPGSVDRGTTQTDNLDLERERGITIRSAVVSFMVEDLNVNLIDTPGHPDFIAEVERALRVLDIIILVVSAVEGVQPQTRRLYRAIRSLHLPCVIFINKIDRPGACADSLLDELVAELEANPLPLVDAHHLGSRDATIIPRDLTQRDVCDEMIEILGRSEPHLLDQWVENSGVVAPDAIRESIAHQFREGQLQPVVFGSAALGVGVSDLLQLLPQIAPAATPKNDEESLAAEVFKVERSPTGERSVICRVWRGCLAMRQTVEIVRVGAEADIQPARVTALLTHQDGRVLQAKSAQSGDIVRVNGLSDARIGDWLGSPLLERLPEFDPPVFEYEVRPAVPNQVFDLRQALITLADEDPLIDVRFDEVDHSSFIHLYGEVQREVVERTLLDRFGLEVTFGEPAVICVERLLGPAAAAEIFGETDPPFYATVGFRIRPMVGDQPTWIYTPGKAKRNFFDAAEIGGRSTLAQGLYGWPVIDLDVEVTDLIYLVMSVPADYRKLAALVMADAVRTAGTVVCEPVHVFALRAPAEHAGGCIHLLSTHRAEVQSSTVTGDAVTIGGSIPAAEIDRVIKALPGVTQGRGDLDTRFQDYQPVNGVPPLRRRTDLNPYNRIEYLSRLKGRF